MNHVGLTHVGINAGMVPHSCGYAVRGRARCNAYARYRVNGIVSIAVSVVMTMKAMMYAPNFYILYSVKSSLAARYTEIYGVVAKAQADNIYRWKAVGSLCNPASAVYAVKSVLFGGILFGYTVASKIVANSSEFIRAIGNLHGIINAPYRVVARFIPIADIVYSVHGMAGTAKSIGYAVKSTMSVTKSAAYKATASLKNTIGAWYYHCTGSVKLMAYVASVPHRIQEFITNKRWFR